MTLKKSLNIQKYKMRILLQLLLPIIINRAFAAEEEIPGNRTDFKRCKLTHMGLDFMGDIQKTEGNIRCQSWSAKNPLHKVLESFTDNKFPEFSKEKARNYCRNPSRNPKGPWCYTTDPNLSDDTCAVPLCSLSVCRVTGPGVEYAGTQDRAFGDGKCLKWDKTRKSVRANGNVTKMDKFERSRFPDGSLSKAGKFCRNPDGDVGGPWCFVAVEESADVVKSYCDVPFCDDQDCMVFTRGGTFYGHFLGFSQKLRNFTFGIKLWDPDQYLEAKAKLVLSILPLPISGKEFEDLGAGIEIELSNSKSALVFGNKDSPEYEETRDILKSTEYTFFTLIWDRGFVTLNKIGLVKPIFLQEIRYKNTLLGHFKNQFHYYSAQGDNVMWSFPFCVKEEDECDIHTTTSSKNTLFWPLRQSDIGHDLNFQLRAFHSANILFVPSPVLDFPNIKISIGALDGYTRIICSPFRGASSIVLQELKFPTLLSYWKYTEISVHIFADSLQVSWTQSIGTFVIMSIKHEVVRSLRWFSPSSDDSVAKWTFFCDPPDNALPNNAYLPECALSKEEYDYIGSQEVSGSGRMCLPWSGKGNFIPKSVKEKFKSNFKHLIESKNFCRDLESKNNATYCYTISEFENRKTLEERCNIRKCKSSECRISGTGNDYIGRLNVTRSNRTCQHWGVGIPKGQEDNYDVLKGAPEEFPRNVKDVFGRAGKIIRELVSDSKPKEVKDQDVADIWNQTLENSDLDGEIIKNTTNSSEFGEEKKLKTSKFAHWLGSVSRNISDTIKRYINKTDEEMRELFMPKFHNVDVKYLNGFLYADLSPVRAENFCRNPSRSSAGAWCYTMDRMVTAEACYVPDCDKNEECVLVVSGKGHAAPGAHEKVTMVFKGRWGYAKNKKIEVAMKVLKPEKKVEFLEEFLNLAGQWAVLRSTSIVRLYGVTLRAKLSMVMELVKLGSLDGYLRGNRKLVKTVDLLEASSNLASALWHMAENGIVHGNIRCKKLLVSCHDEDKFIVKLSDPGIYYPFSSTEVHWIPIEFYKSLNNARRAPEADVWAFATTVWEIFNYGEPIATKDHVGAMGFYMSGKRLKAPRDCPTDIYQLMLECWDADPQRRKQPQAIMRDISQMMYQVYNSRKKHSYAKIDYAIDTISSHTELTHLNDSLVSLCDNEDLSNSTNRSDWSLGSEHKWLPPDMYNSNIEDFSLYNFSNLSSNGNTSLTSLDSCSTIQGILEIGNDCNVIYQGRIGEGFYGEVFKGTLETPDDPEPIMVAIKRLKSSAQASNGLQDFEREIMIMKNLKHPNIVQIFGVHAENEVALVMEYVPHGSLQNYLKIYKDSITTKQLLNYALDIAKGMEYLGKMHIVHRDLAARNILVVDENHVKISDFGLARVLNSNSYYILKTDRALPIIWYALESLSHGKFSTKSDVWSYGVTMTELFSFGEEPKLLVEHNEGDETFSLVRALENGVRFPCPPNCPQLIYVQIIYPCWKTEPNERPTFTDLCSSISELVLRH